MKIFLSLLAVVFISVNVAFAVPAKPVVIPVLQKNGTEISIRLHGDEYFHFKTTEDGILITENANGIFEYAKMNENGKISSTGVLAKNKELRSKNETSFINTLNNNVFELSNKIRNGRAESKKSNAPASTNSLGEKGIVILVNFSDKAFVTPDANTAFCNLLNQLGYNKNHAIGSARDYYIACSDSIFQPTFDVYGPYTLPQTLNYYGQNDAYGNDKNAEQMIIHACSLAYNAGVNFSQYDTNGDGYVDNVFVFFAGYNEAAPGAPSNTIWPHRSIVYSRPQFGSVRIYDYACSSELKNASGTEMDGIGTFVHEFNHVLGLPDLYNTNNNSDTNLEYWDVMDMGCYNGPGKNGDVPAMYSAYEMFYLGWLTPEVLTICDDYSLEPLEKSQRKAYLVAQNDSHNLNGQNPNPTVFYMVENRQKISYDAYLPGSGLLITRINYNYSKWNYNTVNNSSPKGVEIMKAGGAASNWAFPYSSTNSFAFKSTSGTNWGKNVSLIQKVEQNITFNFQQTTCPPSSSPPQPSNAEIRENIIRNKENTEAPICVATSITENRYYDFNIINYPLNWYISMNYGNYLMEIYTVNGILLKTFNFTNEVSVAKSDFPNGVYLLKINDLNSNKSYFSKAIK